MIREINFSNGFNGQLQLENGVVDIGRGQNQAQPYDMMFGALGSCLYATLLNILEKKRTSIQGCKIIIDGVKREEVPTMLKTVHLSVTFMGAEKPQQVEKSFDLATKYCSVYQTLSHVAEMSYELKFED